MQVVPSEHQQAILCCASDGALAQLSKRGYGISSLEVSKSPPGMILCSLLRVAILEQGDGQDELRRCLTTSTFSESVIL